MAATPPVRLRVAALPFVACWAFASLLLVAFSAATLTTRIFPDPDDALRLLQVRDWLAGQSWFDVSQHRINPPDGGDMHWSRLVDLPLAAVIMLLRPLLGTAGAETGALVLVPLLTLGTVMALVAAITHRLLGRERAILACLLTPVSVMAVAQLRPFRIDHHGWQLAFGLAAAWALLDSRPRRGGILAGLATATWLTISLEGLPMAAAVAGWLSWRWLRDPRDGGRLLAFAAALGSGAAVLLALTRSPGAWLSVQCDALTAPYLGALAVAAAGLASVVAAAPASSVKRGIGLLTVAAVSGATLIGIAPACTRGPFVALDPLVASFWYQHVAEGLPVWRQDPAIVAHMLCLPLVGLAGCWSAWRRACEPERQELATLLFLLAAALAVSLLVQRGAGLANLLALPGAVFLVHAVLERSRTVAPLPRAAALLAGLALAVPGLPVAALVKAPAPSVAGAGSTRQCVDVRELRLLRSLPRSTVAAPLDIGPAILVHTPHRIIASGHHRNAAAMRDVIEIFTRAPAGARSILQRHGAHFLVVCPDLIEPQLYAERNPRGLWAELDAGRTPSWLVPVAWPGESRLQVWRIR